MLQLNPDCGKTSHDCIGDDALRVVFADKPLNARVRFTTLEPTAYYYESGERF